MTNSAKTPSGKTSKGKVSVYVEKGRIKVRLPRQYFGGEQERVALGMDANDVNMARAQRLAERMTLDLQDGCFDETLAKYGIVAELKLKNAATSDGQLPPKPELSILEVWDMYCEYKKQKLAETTYELTFKQTYVKFIKDAVESVGENALAIRDWLLKNRNPETTKNLLSHLSHAYKLVIKQKFINYNPFDGLSDDIQIKKRIKIIDQKDETKDDNDVLDKNKAYTWEEALEILKYVKNNNHINHWYYYLKFKFLTGCRTGEASGLWWKDIRWNDECIVIQRTYNHKCNIHKPTKNETARRFPMPKDGELWNLLKSLPEGKPNENVFKSKTGEKIRSDSFLAVWTGNNRTKGIIPELIKIGKLSKYLSPYNTRHTFITHQIYDLGRESDVVNAWCEHSEQISKTCYRNTETYAMMINPELSVKQINKESEIELLREQNKMLIEQIEQMKKMIEQLSNK